MWFSVACLTSSAPHLHIETDVFTTLVDRGGVSRHMVLDSHEFANRISMYIVVEPPWLTTTVECQRIIFLEPHWFTGVEFQGTSPPSLPPETSNLFICGLCFSYPVCIAHKTRLYADRCSTAFNNLKRPSSQYIRPNQPFCPGLFLIYTKNQGIHKENSF